MWFAQMLDRMGSPGPKNFSWFVGRKLAGMGCPRNEAQLAYLAQNGIRTLVDLTEMTCYSEQAENLGITVHQIPIPDYCPPSLIQIQQFMSLLDNTKEVSVIVLKKWQWLCKEAVQPQLVLVGSGISYVWIRSCSVHLDQLLHFFCLSTSIETF